MLQRLRSLVDASSEVHLLPQVLFGLSHHTALRQDMKGIQANIKRYTLKRERRYIATFPHLILYIAVFLAIIKLLRALRVLLLSGIIIIRQPVWILFLCSCTESSKTTAAAEGDCKPKADGHSILIGALIEHAGTWFSDSQRMPDQKSTSLQGGSSQALGLSTVCESVPKADSGEAITSSASDFKGFWPEDDLQEEIATKLAQEPQTMQRYQRRQIAQNQWQECVTHNLLRCQRRPMTLRQERRRSQRQLPMKPERTSSNTVRAGIPTQLDKQHTKLQFASSNA